MRSSLGIIASRQAVARAWSACLLACVAVTAAAAQSPADLGCQLEPGPSRSVARIMDAATIELDDNVRVRLAGILAPQAEDVGAPRGGWPAEGATWRELTRRLQGRTVALAFTGPRSDRHGRTLAHVLLSESDRIHWVQRQMVEEGHARVFAGPGGEACIDRLLEAESAARKAGRGLWADAAYQVRPADRPSELARYRGTFQLVSGRIARAGGTRGLLVLEFESAENPTAMFRVVAARSAPAAKSLGNTRSLEGAEVLVRGWLALDGRGPEVELVAMHQVQRTAAPATQKKAPGR